MLEVLVYAITGYLRESPITTVTDVLETGFDAIHTYILRYTYTYKLRKHISTWRSHSRPSAWQPIGHTGLIYPPCHLNSYISQSD